MVFKKPIRVLVANRPLVMREAIVAVISDQPDIEVVGEVQEGGNVAEAVERLRPDVLVIALDEQKEVLNQVGFFLGLYPEMKIIAVGPERNISMMYWAVVDIRNKAVEHSEDGVLSAMREQFISPEIGSSLTEKMSS